MRLGMVMGLLMWSGALASDHIDGHETRGDRRGDVADVYAWTPAPGRIAVAMTWGPLSRKRARPQEDLEVRLRLRRVDGSGAEDSELTLACTGERGAHRADSMRCTLGGEELVLPWGAVRTEGARRLFAGVRRDPFFIALGKVNDARPFEGARRSVRGVDFLHNAIIRGKVEALVLEVDASEVPGDRPFIGVVAESFRDGRRLDRIGRAELGNFVLADRFGPRELQPDEPEPDVRAAWNQEDAFAVSEGHLPAFVAAADTGLQRLDWFDGATDWPSPHPLRERLLQDWLIVDPTRTCTVDTPSFLEIEAAWHHQRPHQTCGGRTPNDDAVDRLLTWLVNGPERVPPDAPLYGEPGVPAPIRSDGVDRPGQPAIDHFPYLREP